MPAHVFVNALRRIALEVAQAGGGIRSADYEVKMVEHEDEAENLKPAPFLQEPQTLRQNVPAIETIENVIPMPHRRRDEIDGGSSLLRNVRNGHGRSYCEL